MTDCLHANVRRDPITNQRTCKSCGTNLKPLVPTKSAESAAFNLIESTIANVVDLPPATADRLANDLYEKLQGAGMLALDS